MIRILTVTLASASLFLASCCSTKKECSSCDAKPAAECCSKSTACCKSGHKH